MNTISISVTFPDMMTVVADVAIGDTTTNVKEQLAKIKGIHENLFDLLYEGVLLDPKSDFFSNGILHDAELEAELSYKGVRHMAYINTLKGKVERWGSLSVSLSS